MTFSSVSRSCFEVEEVCATAAGVTGFRAGVGAVTRWRAGGAGAATGGGRIGVATSRAAAVAAGGGLLWGTTLRTTGRAFGIGTLCFAGEEAAACFAGGEAGSFAAEGANVVIVSRTQAALESAAGEVRRKHNAKVTAYPADLSDIKSRQRLHEAERFV